MFREGLQIGPYTLSRKLGRGGFGEVWLAERRAKFVTTRVAVKLPHDDEVDPDAIKQEATLWEQAIAHPLLRAAAVAAARGARFSPTRVDGPPVKVSGVITYNFVP